MHTLVAGTGYTGLRVMRLLDEAVGISRSRPAELGEREFHVRDLDSSNDIELIDPGSPYSLLYTVAPAKGGTRDGRLHRLLNALASPPARIVYLSTSGVYGDHAGARVDESALPQPALPRSQRRWQTEKDLLNYCVNTDCELTILRVPGIYGPYRLGVRRILDKAPLIDEAEAGPGNRIHVDDLAACCVRALDTTAPAGIYNVGDGDYRSSTWFIRRIAEMAGLTVPATVSRATALKTFSKRRLSFLRESRRLDNTRMREVLGFEPRYTDPEDGIRASLQQEGLIR